MDCHYFQYHRHNYQEKQVFIIIIIKTIIKSDLFSPTISVGEDQLQIRLTTPPKKLMKIIMIMLEVVIMVMLMM